MSVEQLAYYVALFNQIRVTPEWAAYLEPGAFNPTFRAGAEYNAWLEAAEASYRGRIDEASCWPNDASSCSGSK